MLRVKKGVILPPVLRIYRAAERAYGELHVAGMVTSGMEGQHRPGSRHPLGLALDFRTRDLTRQQVEYLARRIREQLGAGYDVVIERTHLHVEYDPRTPAGPGPAPSG
jgi:hypothetical protein